MTYHLIGWYLRESPQFPHPELSADLIGRGSILTGGGSLLKNMDKRIREETQSPVFINDNPLTTVVLGAGKMLDNLGLLKKMSMI